MAKSRRKAHNNPAGRAFYFALLLVIVLAILFFVTI
jgi:hypothetical protein